jgi:tetratricopeptide (TPR) repeat protein
LSSRKKRVVRSGDAPALPPNVYARLERASALVEEELLDEALDILDDLYRRYPHNADILNSLAYTVYETGDLPRYEGLLEELLEAVPDRTDVVAALATVYFQQGRLAMGLQAARHLVENWPDAEAAQRLSEVIPVAERDLAEGMARLGVEPERVFDLGLLHDEVNAYIARGNYAAAREVAEELLAAEPRFVPALNNLSTLHFAEGRFAEAADLQRRALEIAPDNVHALGNLATYAFLMGDEDTARKYADQMVASTAYTTDRGHKIADTLSLLGDDAGVLAAYEKALEDEGDEGDESDEKASLHHLAAVAAMRTGDDARARRLWQTALEKDPDFSIALDNQKDLANPVGERHAPWPFPLEKWMPGPQLQTLRTRIQQGLKESPEDPVTTAVRQFLETYPGLAGLVPHLLDRGDPAGRELAMMTARTLKTPELLEALRTFATSQRGPDAMRLEAANILKETGALRERTLRMWVNGAWTDIRIMGMEITWEGEEDNRPQEVLDLIAAGYQQMTDLEYEAAEESFTRALELHPATVDARFNRAAAWNALNRVDEATREIEAIHREHPDYLFAAAAVAVDLAAAGKTEEAQKTIDPFFDQERLHITEYEALYGAQVKVHLASGNAEAARGWLDMWKQVAPDSERLAMLESELMLVNLRSVLEQGQEWLKPKGDRKER